MSRDNRRDGWARDGHHPDLNQLAEYVEGILAAELRKRVEVHLSTCTDCRYVVAVVRDLVANWTSGASW